MRTLVFIFLISSLFHIRAQSDIYSSLTGDTIIVQNFKPNALTGFQSGWSVLSKDDSGRYSQPISGWIHSHEDEDEEVVFLDSLDKYNCTFKPKLYKKDTVTIFLEEYKTKRKRSFFTRRSTDLQKKSCRLNIYAVFNGDTIYSKRNFKARYFSDGNETYESKRDYFGMNNSIEAELYTDEQGNYFAVIWLSKLLFEGRNHSFEKIPVWVRVQSS